MACLSIRPAVRQPVILNRVTQYLVSHHYSRHVRTCAGTLQSSSGRSRIALAGNPWILVGAPLLSRRAEGGMGVFAAWLLRKRGSEISVGI